MRQAIQDALHRRRVDREKAGMQMFENSVRFQVVIIFLQEGKNRNLNGRIFHSLFFQ